MDAPADAPDRRTLLWRIAVAALTYYVGSRLGSQLTIPGTSVGLFWPPAGLAVGLVLLWGPRLWPGIALGALAALAPEQVAAHGPARGLAVALGFTIADVIPPLLAGRWLRRSLRGVDPLSGTTPLLTLLLLAGLAAQGVAAVMGVAAGWLTGDLSSGLLLSVGLNWWASNVVSVFVFAPLVLAWRPPWRTDRPARHLAIYAALVASSLVVLWAADPAVRVNLRYLTFLLAIVAAFVVGNRGATLAALLLTLVAAGSVAMGRDQGPAIPAERQFLFLNVYMATVALTGLIVAVVLEERRRAAASLADRERLLRAVLDASPLPITWTDASGRTEFWSARAEEVFGWSHADLPTIDDWFRLAYPDPAERADRARRWRIRLAEAGDGVVTGNDLQVTCKDGTVRSVDILTCHAGERLVTVFSDVTERRRAEAQREELRQQLAQAQRMESVGRLAGGVAHDLNNMLSPILGLADIMLQESEPGSQPASDLAEMKRAAERARDLTRQLLAFGRRQVLALKLVDPRQVLLDLERLLRRTIREDIRLEFKVPAGLGRIRADSGHLEQVVMNLAVNAQHAMPRGGRLTISAADLALTDPPPGGVPPGQWVDLSVADTGTGMPPDVLDRIFEPFFTTREDGHGTGLGLAIVHGIVVQHGGHVRVESQPGVGTTFHIYLPRAEAEAPGLAPATVPATAAAAAAGATILVAEDEPVVRHTVVRLLRRMGHRVLPAGDAAACLQLAAETPGPIDLLVTDVVMPGVNGRELHQRLLATRPGLRVLFMSGYAGDVVTTRGVLDEGLEFIQKPFGAEAFEAAIRRALGHAGPGR